MQGAFDMSSITLAASKDYSKNGENTIVKKAITLLQSTVLCLLVTFIF